MPPLLVEHLPLFLLHLVRAGAFFVTAPTFGTQEDSRMLRLVLAVSLGASCYALCGLRPMTVTSALDLGLLALREALIGLALGFAVAQAITALAAAGEILSNEMGFSMSQVVDPESGKQTVVMSQFFEVMALLLVFSLNLHHDILRVLISVYETLPVGQAFDPSGAFHRLSAMVASALEHGLRYALPVLGIMVMVTAVLVMLSRAVPNINLMDFSFAVRILLALVGSIFFLVEGMPFVETMMRTAIADASALFTGS